MSAEAHVAKDSDEKSYTHSCCSWKVTYNIQTLLYSKIDYLNEIANAGII